MIKNFKNRDKSTDSWQVLRMQGELIKGFDELYDVGASITVFGSAQMKSDDPYYSIAEEFGELASAIGFNVITGGGPGIMEAANKGAQKFPPKSIGVGIDIPSEQGLNKYVDLGVECRYFFVRKVLVIKYSQAFVVFPGGIGTLDELFETLTLASTHHIPRFPIILIGSDFWEDLLQWIEKQVIENGYLTEEKYNELFRVCDTAKEAMDKIMDFHHKYRPDSVVNF